MATILSHGVAAVALGRLYAGREKQPAAFWITIIGLSMLPDVDVLGFRFGIHYADLWGHRGMTHSLLFAVIVGTLAAWCMKRFISPGDFFPLTLLFSLVIISHGLLDALTNGGLGVAFFAPFHAQRYFFPWRPIRVSPMGAAFFSARGWLVLKNEMVWIWLPSAAVFLLGLLLA